MRIELADPRVVRFEIDGPAYWVIFESADRGRRSEHRIIEAPDVESVIAWARNEGPSPADFPRFTLWSEIRGGGDGAGVIVLGEGLPR